MTKKTLLGLWCSLLLLFITISGISSYATTQKANLSANRQPSISADVQPTVRITQAIDERVYTPLRGNTRPEAKNALNYRGPVAASRNIDHILLVLQRSPEQEQALNKLIDQLNDRKSPNFHKWRTADEIGQQYGVAQQDIEKITGWLQSHGLRVNQVYTNGMMIDFSGTAGQVGEAFHTEMGQLEVKGEVHIANMTDPAVPAALAPVVQGIFSLNDFKPHAMNKPVSQYTYAGCAATTDRPTGAGTCYAMTPQDNQTIYNLNPLYAAGISGQGQTIVLVEDTDSYGNDWQSYRNTFGLTTQFPAGSYTQVHPGCTDPGTNADDSEADLDVEVASAIAPSAAIELISCASGDVTFGGLIALENLVNGAEPYPGIVSVSYGVCEALDGNGGNQAFYNTYQTAAAEGISVFGASGDEGPSSCSADLGNGSGAFPYDEGSLGISGWTSTPFNISVGGTDFEDTYNSKEGGLPLSTYWNATNTPDSGSAKSYIPEMPWNDACANLQISYVADATFAPYGSGTCNHSPFNTTSGYEIPAGGSGGASNCFTGAGGADAGGDGISDPECQGLAKPSWQSGSSLAGGLAVYGQPSDGVRDIPDVAMFAANGLWSHYEVVCWSDPAYTADGSAACTGAPSTWSGFGGTSVASPSMAAIQALINQQTGQYWGNPAPYYYQIAQNEYGTAGGTFQGANCNSSGSGGPAAGCAFNDVTEGDIDILCRDDSTLEEAHCYKPSSTNGVDSTDVITAATVIWGGTGYTTAPTCTIAGPTNNQPYLTPTLPSGRTQVWAGGTQASCTATVTAASTTAVWTVAMESVDGVGETIVLTNVPLGGSTTCGPYTLAGSTTTLMASGLVTSIGSGCSLASATSSTTTATITAKTAGAAGNFITEFGPSTVEEAFYVWITNTVKGQGPNYVSGITIPAGQGGSGYQPETPITLTGVGTGALAVANTSIGTAPTTYQPAYGAAPGYDLATGLGSPNATALVNACAWLPSTSPGIYSPANMSSLTGTSATFQWYPNASATNYWIDVGSTYGGNNYEQSGPLGGNGCAFTVNNLPENGGTIYVTWWYYVGGSWSYNEYTYTTAGPGVITTPAPNSTLTSSTVTFDWTQASGTQFWITAGNVQGGAQYFSSGNLGNVLTYTNNNNLPTDGSTIYVTLFSYVNNQWLYNEYTYTAVGGSGELAMITSPPNNTEVDGTSATFTWTAGNNNPQAYWLDIGTSVGGNNIYQSGPLSTSTLSQMVSGLPNNGTEIYGTMWTEIGGQWYYNDSYMWQSGPMPSKKPGQKQPQPMIQKQLTKR